VEIVEGEWKEREALKNTNPFQAEVFNFEVEEIVPDPY
jgi:hypothetical protein